MRVAPESAPLILPIFPLPDATLFPETYLPLHVFEARYRAMVTDALARNRRLCVARLAPGWEAAYEGKPAVEPVAGAGEIVSCERLATGRFNILLKGTGRVRIDRELPTDTLYRVVAASRCEEVAASGDLAGARARLRAACAQILDALGRPANLLDGALADELPPGVVADRVTASVIPDATLRQTLLEMLDASQRLARVVAAVEQLVAEIKGGHE
jgi:Lon protease-like protein